MKPPMMKPGFSLRTLTSRDFLVVMLPLALVIVAGGVLAVKLMRPAPPSVIRFITGPAGSTFRNNAAKYKKHIEAHGVKVEIVESQGSLENLRRLVDAQVRHRRRVRAGRAPRRCRPLGAGVAGHDVPSAAAGVRAHAGERRSADGPQGQAAGDRTGGQRHARARAHAAQGQQDGGRGHPVTGRGGGGGAPDGGGRDRRRLPDGRHGHQRDHEEAARACRACTS